MPTAADDDLPPLPRGFLAEPVPNARAVEWLQSKTPMGAKVFKGLLPELKARAIAVSGITSASLARDIREAIAKLPAGADWDKTKRQIADQISPWVSPGDDKAAKKARLAKAELILRTHGFQAYAVAQHETMREQQDIFPYWQYLSMEDANVRTSHAALNKLIFPATAPFWHRHTPPWDWGCRCRKVQLLEDEVAEIRAREAKLPPEKQTVIEGVALDMVEKQNKLNRGLTQVIDITPPADKGKPGAFLFEPDSLKISPQELAGRYDPQTWQDFQQWAHQTEVETGTTVWQWMGGAQIQLPPAVPPVTPPAAVPAPVPAPAPAPAGVRTLGAIAAALDTGVAKWSGLIAEKGTLFAEMNAARRRGDRQETIRLASEHAAKEQELEAFRETLRAMVEVPEAERGRVLFTKKPSAATEAAAKAGAALTERYTHANLLPTVGVKYSSGRRAFHRSGNIHINSGTSTSVVMHEITHATEQQTAATLAASQAFLKKRAGTGPLKSLRSLTGLRYKADEYAYEDEFAKRGGDHYMGKYYGPRATELLTMGIERLHRDPLEFYLADREYFDFMIQTLQLL